MVREGIAPMISRLFACLSRTRSFHCQIGDFGSTRVVDLGRTKDLRTPYFNPGDTGDTYSTSDDIYAAALTFYLLMELQCVPYPGVKTKAELDAFVASGGRPPLRPEYYAAVPGLQDLIEDMWAPDASSRPSATDALKYLQALVRSAPDQQNGAVQVPVPAVAGARRVSAATAAAAAPASGVAGARRVSPAVAAAAAPTSALASRTASPLSMDVTPGVNAHPPTTAAAATSATSDYAGSSGQGSNGALRIWSDDSTDGAEA